MPRTFSNTSNHTFQQVLNVWDTNPALPSWYSLDVTVGTCDVQESDKLANAGVHMSHEHDDNVSPPPQARPLCETQEWMPHLSPRAHTANKVLGNAGAASLPNQSQNSRASVGATPSPYRKDKVDGSAAWAAATGVLPW